MYTSALATKVGGATAAATGAAGAGAGAETAGECGVIGDDVDPPGESAADTKAGAVPYLALSDFASLAGL